MWETIEGNYEMNSLYLEANFDGSGTIFCSRAAETIAVLRIERLTSKV